MATEYFLPVVGSITTSPPAKVPDSTSGTSSNNSNVTVKSFALPQLPSLTKHGRLSITSISSKNERLPLTSIDVNEAFNTNKINASSKSIDESSQRGSIQPMELDIATPQLAETQPVEKTMDLVYPSNAKRPSRSLVQALFDEALKLEVNSDEAPGDQQNLCDAGLLSLEQVLLPAVAYQEEQMLKKWQSIVQRDGSALQKATIVSLRKAVYTGIGVACAAVQQSRDKRARNDQAREHQWQLEIEQKKAVLAQEHRKHTEALRQQREDEALKRKCDAQKKLPANQDVWREVAYLMTELTKLSQEEQQWRNVASQHLDRSEALLIEQEKQFEDRQKREETNLSLKEEMLDNTVQQVVKGTTDTAMDISLAVERIRNTLRHISDTAAHGEQSRQQLYHQYVTHHQFYGYQGIHDPKGLLKVLSQSQQSE